MQNYHLTEHIEINKTLWVIEKDAPNSGIVIYETADKEKAFIVLDNLNNKKSECDIAICKSYNKKYDFNCEVNNFTFGISFCRKYMGIDASEEGEG